MLGILETHRKTRIALLIRVCYLFDLLEFCLYTLPILVIRLALLLLQEIDFFEYLVNYIVEGRYNQLVEN